MKTKTITYLDEREVSIEVIEDLEEKLKKTRKHYKIAQHIIAFFFGYTVIPIILKIIK